VIGLVYGYRTLTAFLVFRSLPDESSTGPPTLVDGERVALAGDLVVERPVETGDAAVEDADRPVGGYLWRARLPDNSNGDLTIEDSGYERRNWHTFASGVKWGRSGVVAPTELQISFTDGLGDAESAQLDIQWSELRMYWFHYVDSDDVNWRFDRHPNTHSPEIHFYPPARGCNDGRRTVLHRRHRSLTRDACRPCDVASSLRGRHIEQLNSASHPP
jgi:hypothetical protein